MAETAAAPAAPSTGAPPSAQPATGAAAPAPAPQPAADTQAAAPAARKALAPIPRLPGVFPDGDPFPPPPGSPDAGSSSAPPSGPQRGPDGRFVAGTSPAAPDGERTLEPAKAAPPPTPPPKFKFGGEEFDSQEAAEQNFRTLRGQYKPLQQLARSLGGVDKVVPQFAQAAESARSWKAEHDRVKAELDAARKGAQPAAETQTPEKAAAEPADVDWELYAEVKKLATESGEPWKAEQWLTEQVRKADAARYQKMLDERLAPLDAQQEQQATVERTEALFTSLAGYTNPDGSPAFPELSDETAAYEVGKLWYSLGLPRESALTPQGAMAAIGLYRLARGGSQAKTAPAATTTVTPPAPPTPTDAASAAGLTDGRPTVVSAPGNGNAPSAEAMRILAGLRQANTGKRSALGFDA